MWRLWKILAVIILVFSVYLKYFLDENINYDKKIKDFVNDHGYSIEFYETITEDGYILKLHRIPGSLSEKNPVKKKPPVFLMHGLLLTSFDWIILGKKSMAFILAEAGYDVWLGNNRGNTFSRSHTRLDPDQDMEFWEYSFHEIGMYDLPAMLDKILNVTQEKKLTYIGFSEGFTSFLVMGSQKPEYNEKIKTMHAFAPVTDMHQIKSPVLNMFRLIMPIVKPGLNALGLKEWFTIRIFTPCIRKMAENQLIGVKVVRYILHLIGASYNQMDLDFLKVIFSVSPGGISLRQLDHYLQTSRTGHFRPYYQTPQEIKDDYDISKVTTPIFLYYSSEDYLVNNDILLNQVAPKLNIKKTYKIPEETFNHADFLWGSDIANLTNEALRDIDYNSKKLNNKSKD